MKKIDLQRRLDQEEYILGGIRPNAKTYQAQFQKVKDIKSEIEFLEIQERSKKIQDSDNSDKGS
ncbi:hypothetical protein [Pedobacter antarcticus]|uniref:hypothetical protein n=1 Tax=Pedobacter antarcticus TaxID=34086 RepID=UPI00292E7554|nr:hypothetical protein [Pedobacter antarcticus]